VRTGGARISALSIGFTAVGILTGQKCLPPLLAAQFHLESGTAIAQLCSSRALESLPHAVC
jgi:hypothetical protein